MQFGSEAISAGEENPFPSTLSGMRQLIGQKVEKKTSVKAVDMDSGGSLFSSETSVLVNDTTHIGLSAKFEMLYSRRRLQRMHSRSLTLLKCCNGLE